MCCEPNLKHSEINLKWQLARAQLFLIVCITRYLDELHESMYEFSNYLDANVLYGMYHNKKKTSSIVFRMPPTWCIHDKLVIRHFGTNCQFSGTKANCVLVILTRIYKKNTREDTVDMSIKMELISGTNGSNYKHLQTSWCLYNDQCQSYYYKWINCYAEINLDLCPVSMVIVIEHSP
jgi:hypothetical protein